MDRETQLRTTVDRETMEEVENLAASRAGDFVGTTSTADLRLDDTCKETRPLVGIHELGAELQSRMSSSQQLKIVSIVGSGGLGKTTLANAVYDNIKGDFCCSAFVSVGRQPDLNEVLRNILIDLGKGVYKNLNMTMLNQTQLIDELHHFLQSKRFLIVIDDIWDIPSWEVIKCALVESDCGSRIITTSRSHHIAETSGEVFELMPLSIAGSEELFYGTLFGHKGKISHDPLDEHLTRHILHKCGGVPLAIITLASLLAGKPQEEWSKVYNSIGFGDEDNTRNIRNIIQFSYYDLPSHLKTCLLYLAIFPEHKIDRDTLIWKWVAEGFVPREPGKSLFKVGERYLNELVNKSLIQPVADEDTNVYACCVHDMVLDSILIQNMDLKEHGLLEMWNPKLRQFNDTGCGIKVLNLSDLEVDNTYFLGSLRSLEIRHLNTTCMPLKEIGHLTCLETLELRDTCIKALPHSVTLLRQLKCLRCSDQMLELPEGMGNLTSLEEMRLRTINKFPNFAEELSKMTKLRVIHIYTEDLGDKWKEASVESLGKLQKIEELVLISDGQGSDDPCRYVIGPDAFPKLQYMKMNNWLRYQPAAMPCLTSVELNVHVRVFNDANFDFHDFYKLRYLSRLEKARVVIVCWEAKTEDVEEAEATLRRVVQHHPNRPMLILERFGQCANDKQLEDSRSGGSGSTHRDVDNKQKRDKLHHSQVAPEIMSLELLKKITKDFSKERELGSGTFGKVYKGVQNGKEIAVKRLSQRSGNEEEFRKEYENLRRLNHPNIIQLLGYCYEIKCEFVQYEERFVLADSIYRALCFDYMHNGSLQGHLNDEFHGLEWRTRYKIIKGTCEGLKYLHEGLETPMYHLDLKPGNILLNKNMVPKLADFGLSKPVCNNETQATSSFLGTRRYCPPEYIDHGYVSNKFDIFSLGVVMIEIIAGPEGYCKAAEMPSQEFVDHVQENWRERLEETPGCTSLIFECRQVNRCIEIALDCISADRKQRPSIGDIASWLNEIENNTEKLSTTSTSQNKT